MFEKYIQEKRKKLKGKNRDIGVNIDKNEYREIVLSQTNHPEKMKNENY